MSTVQEIRHIEEILKDMELLLVVDCSLYAFELSNDDRMEMSVINQNLDRKFKLGIQNLGEEKREYYLERWKFIEQYWNGFYEGYWLKGITRQRVGIRAIT